MSEENSATINKNSGNGSFDVIVARNGTKISSICPLSGQNTILIRGDVLFQTILIISKISEKIAGAGVCVTALEGNPSKLLVDEVCEKTESNGVCITGVTSLLKVDEIEGKNEYK